VAFVASAILDTLMRLLAVRSVPVFFQCLIGGAVGPIAAAIAHVIEPKSSAWLVAVATIIMLLAGVTTVAAVQDLLSGLYVTGMARFTEAVVVTFGIASGVVGATRILEGLGVPLDVLAPNPAIESVSMMQAGLAAALVVGGFSLATQVPLRAFVVVTLFGALAELLYLTGLATQWGPIWSSAGAAVVVGVLTSMASRITSTPHVVIVVPSLIPLVPGLLVFSGLMSLMASSVEGLLDVMAAAAVAVALAAGAMFGLYSTQLAFGHKRIVPMAIPGHFGLAQVKR
jgi:uncharacterized membrane protein YjjB (DUF3815 family)